VERKTKALASSKWAPPRIDIFLRRADVLPECPSNVKSEYIRMSPAVGLDAVSPPDYSRIIRYGAAALSPITKKLAFADAHPGLVQHFGVRSRVGPFVEREGDFAGSRRRGAG